MMPMGMQPPGFADQMRNSGQIGPPPGGPPMGQAGPPMGGPPPMGAGPGAVNPELLKMLIPILLQILSGAHNGGPPPGAPGMAGQSPGMPM